MSVAQATFAATVVDEWLRAGVTEAVVCPGSRSTPLALALAARPELRLHVRLDERSAGFFALGLALANGRPAVVCTTSGTAAVELHPAVVEAHHGRVPMIACTADRPPELQGVGAPQTIDQVGLYGTAVRWSAAPGVPEEAARATWRSLAARSVAEALDGPSGPGPVHLNLAFRDPLVGEPGPLPGGPPGGLPVHRVAGWDGGGEAAGTARRWAGRRGVVVAGAGAGPPGRVLALVERLAWPLLADPRSGCRVDHPCVVAAADALLRSPPVASALRPEVVLLLGAPWASKVVGEWVAGAGAEVVAVDPWWRWADPGRVVATVHRADPGRWLDAALDGLGAAGSGSGAPGAPGPGAPAGGTSGTAGGWLAGWQGVEAAAQRAIDEALGGELTEPAVARTLYRTVGQATTIVTSSSMPVRDLEWYAAPLARPPRVLANRGANGIDGVCSTALGAAAAGTGPVVGLVGDLAFLHDVSSLVAPSPLSTGGGGGGPAASSCILVVVDNGGGGIFDFLPQAAAVDRDRFERVFGTPMAPDVARVAAGFGWEVADVGELDALGPALRSGLASVRSVVRLRVPDRRANVAVHERVHRAVAGATAEVLGVRAAEGAAG